MERLYCTINEEQARIAHDMMSMSDYKVGRKLQKQDREKRIELKHWQRDIQREWPST